MISNILGTFVHIIIFMLKFKNDDNTIQEVLKLTAYAGSLVVY